MIKLIAAVGKSGELSRKGKLIWHLPEDLHFFKRETMGHIVVMGLRTFNSLPKKLSGRTHYVLTKTCDFNKDVSDVKVFADISKLIEEVRSKAKHEDVYIIGGERMYREFLEYADEIILTEIDEKEWTAEAYFPDFDKKQYEKHFISSNEYGGITYSHVKYVKK